MDKERCVKKSSVTIIIPVFNVEEFLPKCIESVLSQTFTKIEIILVDDGSTDNSGSICDSYAVKDPRLKVIHKKNGGLSDARNAGLDKATGDFILFVDGDDFVSPTLVEEALKSLGASNADLCIFGYNESDENGRLCGNNDFSELKSIWTPNDFWNYYFGDYRVLCTVSWNKLYRRDLFDGLRFEKGFIHEDEIILHKILQRTRILCFLNRPLYYYVQRTGSIMQKKGPNHLLGMTYALIERTLYFSESFPLFAYYSIHNINTNLFLLKKACLSASEKGLLKQIRKQKRRLTKMKVIKRMPFKYKAASVLVNNWFFGYRIVSKLHRLFSFVCDKRIRWLRKCSKKQCSVLLDTPIHGNAGDQAIAMSERLFLRGIGHPADCEFNHEEIKRHKRTIFSAINRRALVMVHGGGFIGTLWPEEHEVFMKILHRFRNNKIIVFPQTIYFSDEDSERRNAFFVEIAKCRDLTIFVRDEASMSLLRRYGFKKTVLVPDIVLTLPVDCRNELNSKEHKIVLCFRHDHEAISKHERLLSLLQDSDLPYDITDTVENRAVSEAQCNTFVKRKLSEFSSASLVICDRLHAMIFCALVQTPCIAIDNISKKISGVFRMLESNDYIRCVPEEEISASMIKQMLELPPCTMSIVPRARAWDELKSVIEDYYENRIS